MRAPAPFWGSRCHAPDSLDAPGGTIHVVARCNNRECSVTTPADCEVLLAHLGQMRQTYALTL